MRRRPAARPALKRLSFFAHEQTIPKESHMWPQITLFQREGLVALHWGNSSHSCGVKLTEKGEAEVKRRQDAGELT